MIADEWEIAECPLCGEGNAFKGEAPAVVECDGDCAVVAFRYGSGDDE